MVENGDCPLRGLSIRVKIFGLSQIYLPNAKPLQVFKLVCY